MHDIRNVINIMLVIMFSILILLSVFYVKYISYNIETIDDFAEIIVEAGDIVDTGDQNLFNEWIWINKNEGTDKEAEYVWEYVSTKSLDIDLTAYVKRTEMTAYVEEKLLTGTWW